MSASSGSESQHQESGAGEAGKGSPAKTGAWVPKVKQQQHQQSDDRRSSTAVASAIHDLGSDLIEAAGSESAGKGKNRSKNKKMNWKPLAVPIIRRDPHDRDRDIRGSTRKYGFSGMGGGSAGGKKTDRTVTNGFRNSAAAGGSGGSGGSSGSSAMRSNTGTNNNMMSNQNNCSNNLLTHSLSHPPHNNPNNNHQHQHHHYNSAQSNSSDDSKLNRSSSVSSSSSSRRNHPPHHQQQHHNQHHHHPHQAQHSDQIATPTSPSAGIGISSSQPVAGEIIKLSNNNNNYNQQPQQHRVANGSGASGGNRVAGRPPVLRQSAGQSPPSSPSVMTQPPQPPQPQQPQQQQHPHRKQQSDHQPYYGRRSGPRAAGSSNGGSGRATPNSLKDFSSPEVQYFPMEYATLNHDPNSLSNKTSGLMSPVLTLPHGAVVLPAATFATGPPVAATPNLAPFYPPTVLPAYAAIPVATGLGSQTVTMSTPSGLLPVSAFTMPSLPPDPQDLRDKIRAQIEYYFSQENLQRDIFIRKKMDSEGYLPISLIASFHRLQLLTPDVSVIIQSLENSASVELSENHLKARPRDNPLSWPIASETPIMSPTSPPAAHLSPLTNGQPMPAAVAAAPSPSPVNRASASSAVKSLNEIPAQDRIGPGSETDSPEKRMQQLKLSGGAEECNGERISTRGSKHDQHQTGKGAGAGVRGNVSPKQPSPPSSSPSAAAVPVTAAASSSDATLHPDVPSFVPGQLYAAVVGSSSSSSKV